MSSTTSSAPLEASASTSATTSASLATSLATSLASSISTLASSTAETAPAETSAHPDGAGVAQDSTGISLVAFVTALAASLVVFGIQMGFFLLLRNKLVRILCVAVSHLPPPVMAHR